MHSFSVVTSCTAGVEQIMEGALEDFADLCRCALLVHAVSVQYQYSDFTLTLQARANAW